ncbi:MAG: hypothetical protein FWD76_06325 [Firmicutes bacterium]|nr:hypothetical protein [Bacillota bacterium]
MAEVEEIDIRESEEYSDLQKMDMKEKNLDVSKCPNCGATTAFDAATQKLKCDHCGTELDFAKEYANQERAIEELLGASTPWDEDTSVFRCDNCGAVEVVHSTELAKDCPYCRSTSVVKSDQVAGLKPYSLLPFALTQARAGECVENWVRKKAYAPGKYKKAFRAENLRGVYNPAFTFDSKTFSTYKGKLGRHETRTRRGANGQTETYTETVWFYVSGTWNDFFDDILIQASTTIAQKTIDKLSPFHLLSAQKYVPNYLYGYSANQYNRDGMDCWADARRVIDKSLYRKILGQYHYDTIGYMNIDTYCSNVTFKYLLLPIYVGASKFKNKVFNYFVNGVTGKVYGKSPLSGFKVFLTIAIPLVAVGIGALVWYLTQK